MTDTKQAWLVRPYEASAWALTTEQPTDELRRWLEFKPVKKAAAPLPEDTHHGR